jgi:trehalose-6-phosphate synthase
MSKLLISSNRGPNKDGVSSAGGLVSALSGLLKPSEDEKVWICSGGMGSSTDGDGRQHYKDEHYDFFIRPVRFNTIHLDHFYNQFANGFLWPLMHLASDSLHKTQSEFPEPQFNQSDFVQYNSAQIIFANTMIEETIKRGDVWTKDEVIIWNHDYHLMQASMRYKEVLSRFNLNKSHRERIHVGQFIHTPFFNIDAVEDLCSADQSDSYYTPLEDNVESAVMKLMIGLLSNDYIGFHTRRYSDNFVSVIDGLFNPKRCGLLSPLVSDYILGIEQHGEDTVIRHKNGVTCLGCEPIGIDVEHVLSVVQPEDTLNYKLKSGDYLEAMIGQDKKKGKIIFGGLERCDYTKGLLSRVDIFEHAYNELHQFSEIDSKLYQITAPSRLEHEDYQRLEVLLREKVESANEHINNSIVHINSGIIYPHNFRFMREVDVMMVTPLEDGMNLVALEYILSQKYNEHKGLLVIGNCGAADFLSSHGFGIKDGVVHVPIENPARAGEMIAHAISKEYGISDRLVNHIETYSRVEDWADRNLEAIRGCKNLY